MKNKDFFVRVQNCCTNMAPPNALARFWASNSAKLRAANGVSRSKLPLREDLPLCLASFALSPQVGTIVRAQRGKEPTKKPRLWAWFSVGSPCWARTRATGYECLWHSFAANLLARWTRAFRKRNRKVRTCSRYARAGCRGTRPAGERSQQKSPRQLPRAFRWLPLLGSNQRQPD